MAKRRRRRRRFRGAEQQKRQGEIAIKHYQTASKAAADGDCYLAHKSLLAARQAEGFVMGDRMATMGTSPGGAPALPLDAAGRAAEWAFMDHCRVVVAPKKRRSI